MNVRRITDMVAGRAYEIFTGRPAYERRYPNKTTIVPRGKPEFDLVYVLPPETEPAWILNAICREIDTYFPGTSMMYPQGERLPTASCYFYSHYAFFRDTLLRQPEVLAGRNILFYTHPRDLWFSEAELLHSFEYADKIVSMCSMHAQRLQDQGVSNVCVSLTGADSDFFFRPHQGRQVSWILFQLLPSKKW